MCKCLRFKSARVLCWVQHQIESWPITKLCPCGWVDGCEAIAGTYSAFDILTTGWLLLSLCYALLDYCVLLPFVILFIVSYCCCPVRLFSVRTTSSGRSIWMRPWPMSWCTAMTSAGPMWTGTTCTTSPALKCGQPLSVGSASSGRRPSVASGLAGRSTTRLVN